MLLFIRHPRRVLVSVEGTAADLLSVAQRLNVDLGPIPMLIQAHGAPHELTPSALLRPLRTLEAAVRAHLHAQTPLDGPHDPLDPHAPKDADADAQARWFLWTRGEKLAADLDGAAQCLARIGAERVAVSVT